jgi:hypothetical protein
MKRKIFIIYITFEKNQPKNPKWSKRSKKDKCKEKQDWAHLSICTGQHKHGAVYTGRTPSLLLSGSVSRVWGESAGEERALQMYPQ